MSIEELCRKIGETPEELEAFADGVARDDPSFVVPAPEVVEAHLARLIAGLMREVAELQRRHTPIR